MLSALWIFVGFVCGSLPFSYWMGLIFLHKDIRQVGDGAPGATGVRRAGGKSLYIIAILMDAFKGTIPVWLAQLLSGVTGWELALVAISPVAGHAFSPFLHFQGGMGVATTYGVWLALLGWAGPVIMGIGVGFMFIFQKNWVWSTIGGMLGLLIFLIAFQHPPYLWGTCAGHTAILFYKRYFYFKNWPEPQSWIVRVGGKD